MTDDAFDRRLSDALRDYAADAPVEVTSLPFARAIIAGHRRRSTSLQLAAVIAIVAVVAVGAMNVFRPGTGPGSTLSPTPTSSVPMFWTPEAAALDWPGPLRTEAAPGAAQLFRVADYTDGIGDSGAPDPWTDITHVKLRTGTTTVDSSNPIVVEVVGGLSSVPDPATVWIAYGVDLDLDGDGQADQRIGIDNSTSDHREWITDLATGQTAVNSGPEYGGFGAFGTRIETWFVDSEGLAGLIVKRTPGGIRFYAWASTISGGGVVATDFAPDTGWIETISP